MVVMLIEWVVTSAFLILVVLALRAALGKRVSARLRYALWAVVLVRLLVPVQLFTSPIAGTFVLLGSDSDQGIYTVPDPPTLPDAPDNVLSLGGQDGPSVALTNFPQAPDPPTLPDTPEPPAAPDLTKAPVWLGWTWLTGSAAVALVLLVSNLRFYWKLRRERIPLEGADCSLRVYAAVGLPSPCLFGIFRPAVYVTPEAAADPDMLRHVIAHEYTHYRQGDHLWSLLRCGALAAHWWNPLVWLAAVLSQRDAELACDEGALKRLGDGERAGYGKTLLALVTAKPRPADLLRCATTMAGDKKSLKERISRIAKAPKRVIWAVVVAVLVTALACVCAFGQAAEDTGDGPEPDPTPEPSSAQVVPAYNETGEIPAQVQLDAEEFVRERFESLRDNGILFGVDGASAVIDPPEVDLWQIERLSPCWNTELCWNVLGLNRRLELWNVCYSFHTTEPEKAKESIIGAILDLPIHLMPDKSGGWLTYLDGNANYLVYEIGEDGSRTLLTEFWDMEWVHTVAFRRNLRTKLASLGVPEDQTEWYDREESAESPLDRWTDLSRSGVSEFVQVVDFGSGRRVEVWVGDKLLWVDEGYYAHMGWNAVFLCTLDGKDYLLRYHPNMGQGWCTYSYELFTLTRDGKEKVVRENSVEFDINFGPMHESFDPEAIAAFMDEVNGLLAHSVQLLNTDEDLAPTFEKEGRLYDSLGWLDWDWGTFVRDDGKSLLENLRDFKEAMEQEAYVDTPTVFPVDELGTDIRLDYRDKSVRFQCPGWDTHFQPAEHVEPKILDLNGDGRDEIVVVLIWGHGTGCLIENLFVFDADTLEQYDTSGLNETILNSIESTGDENNFYLSAPRMDRVTIPRSAAEERNLDAPMADALALGKIIEYMVQNGRVVCRLGCDASGMTTNYIGHLNITLDLTPQGGVRCVSAQYTPVK